MATLEVIEPGLMVQLQDIGRLGMGHFGLAQGGPMDLQAYCWANYLLDNDMSCPQLEITAGQCVFKALVPVTLALTGADLGARINDQAVASWQTIHLDKDDRLSFQFPRKGFRAYLAVPGGFSAPEIFGSAATVVRDHLGGLPGVGEAIGRGQLIRQGDRLNAAGCSYYPEKNRMVPAQYVPEYGQSLQLRLIESYQWARFSAGSQQALYRSTFTLSTDSDRMGYRLKGAVIEPPCHGIISEGIAPGAVQIPDSGQPVILMRDRQTLGGYPKVGCIAQLDLGRLAQAMPGTTIRFSQVVHARACDELNRFLSFFNL